MRSLTSKTLLASALAAAMLLAVVALLVICWSSTFRLSGKKQNKLKLELQR